MEIFQIHADTLDALLATPIRTAQKQKFNFEYCGTLSCTNQHAEEFYFAPLTTDPAYDYVVVFSMPEEGYFGCAHYCEALYVGGSNYQAPEYQDVKRIIYDSFDTSVMRYRATTTNAYSLSIGVTEPPPMAASISLPQTGQTKCFDSAGQEILCEGTGQDADLRKGTSWPVPRFTDNGDGTITDNLTGLMWLKDANCAATIGHDPDSSGNGSMSWLNALNFVKGINNRTYDISGCSLYSATYNDWHLPNINELESLLSYGVTSMSDYLRSSGFNNIQDHYYWSSTSGTYVYGGQSNAAAKVLHLKFGYTVSYPKSYSPYNPYKTLPVRQTQTSLFAPTKIWRTGQATCYSEQGVVIECNGTGQDGEIQAGIPWPVPRFTDNLDGTVTDNMSGLMWTKYDCVLGANEAWQNKLDGIAQMNAGIKENYGFNDWRLPNIKELRSLLSFESDRALPSGHPFTIYCQHSWASTTSLSDGAERAWMVTFFDRQGDQMSNDKLRGGAPGWPVRSLSIGYLFSITPSSITVPEDAGSITFTVNRADTSKDETRYVSTVQNQGFENQNDYVGLLNQPLFFAAGQSTQQVAIQISDDAIPEPDETFGLIVQADPTNPIETFLASATFTILDNDTAQPSPVLGVTPNDLNFGPVAVNQTSTIKDFTVSNTGSGILSGTCTTSPPFYFAYGPCTYDLAANEFADVPLYFQPTTEGTFAGTVNFSSNAGNIARTVTGIGTTATTPQPAISVSGKSLNFAPTVVGQTSSPQTVTVTNTGTANLTVGTLTLAGDNPGDYLLSTNTCNSANLAPQATCSFAVAFKPTAVGTRTASVSIPSNDPVSPTTSLLLTGSGLVTILSAGANCGFKRRLSP
jgi:hypothetical protein